MILPIRQAWKDQRFEMEQWKNRFRVRREYGQLQQQREADEETLRAAAHHSPPESNKGFRVLLVGEKWCDCNPEYGLSNNEHNLCGSLLATGLAQLDRFYYDEYQRETRRPCDKALLHRCIRGKPDLLLLSWVPRQTPHLNRETLKIISQEMQIPIVAFWYDFVLPRVARFSESLLPFVSLHVVLDSCSGAHAFTRQPEKYLSLWTPQDPRVFFDAGLERTIDVSFVGTIVDSVRDRRAGIAALRQSGIEVYTAGGQRHQRLPIKEYALVYQKSKIVINFCRCMGRLMQTKGRIFEATHCGAMLLEEANPDVDRWFVPHSEYVPFANLAELVDAARYFLEHDRERLEIARRGNQKAQQRYSAERFWNTVFNRAFKNAPPPVLGALS